MIGTELHVQASIWKRCQVRERRDHGRVCRAVVSSHAQPAGWWHTHMNHWSHDTDIAVLVMEGETASGDESVVDALYSAVLTRGLALVTDLDHLDLRPAPGWRVEIDEAGTVTVEWPHTHPLLRTAPVDLPPGWCEAAAQLRLVVVIAGYGLDLAAPAAGLLASRLEHAARAGAVAAGAVAATSYIRPGGRDPVRGAGTGGGQAG